VSTAPSDVDLAEEEARLEQRLIAAESALEKPA
jgi:hypothetical protein